MFAEHGIAFPPNRPRREGEVQYVVNLDIRVIDFLKSQGGDWQSLLNEKLLELVPHAKGNKKAS